MTDLLTDSVAVVTGAASGNGRAIAKQFAAHGADVVVADIREEPREGGVSTVDWIETETAEQATFVHCDVSEITDLKSAMEAARSLGGIDILVNNAGIVAQEAFFETTEAEFDAMVDVNLKGVFFGSQLAAKQMTEDTGGVIINLSSVAGMVGSRASVTYSATKGAVRLMTYSLAAQLGQFGIRVNAIHPGTTNTSMLADLGRNPAELSEEELAELTANIPLGRLGEPEDVANMAVLLASDLTGYVTGTSVLVDGGRTNAYP